MVNAFVGAECLWKALAVDGKTDSSTVRGLDINDYKNPRVGFKASCQHVLLMHFFKHPLREIRS